MAFAPRRPADSNVLPKRTSSLRVSSTSSVRSRTPSTTINPAPKKEQGNLNAINETSPKKSPPMIPPRKTSKSPPAITWKKSQPTLKTVPSSTCLREPPSGPAPETAIINPALRDARARPRPISVSGIPSPTPTRTSSLHARKDKYGALVDGAKARHGSVRSISANWENKLIGETKPQAVSLRKVVPPRSSSRTGHSTTQPTNDTTSLVTTEAPKAPPKPIHSRKPSKDVPSAVPGARKPSKPPPSKDASSAVETLKQKASPVHGREKTTKPPLSEKSSQKSLSSKASKDSVPPLPKQSPHQIRKQASKDLSPSPSPKVVRKSSSLQLSDVPPEQHRLLQLLNLIPLSAEALNTYETSAHRALSQRYAVLQDRFHEVQKKDHAQYLSETLSILKSWTDSQIRALSNLIADWDSLTSDLRAFCKRLTTTLKPINKSIIEEKERLFSRLHDLEGVLVLLPATRSVPGQIIEEIRFNLPLLRREVEMSMTVAGLKWRREVLSTEVKKMEVVKRLSIGKPRRDNAMICAWRE